MAFLNFIERRCGSTYCNRGRAGHAGAARPGPGNGRHGPGRHQRQPERYRGQARLCGLSKIIIGRKRIEESGLRTVEELLRREPAVTVSGDGSIGLLNLPGYTQILVDGQAPGPNQAPAVLDLARVERVEIVKTTVAEFGPFWDRLSTINMVTRNTVRKTATNLSTALSSKGGKLSSSANLDHHQSSATAAAIRRPPVGQPWVRVRQPPRAPDADPARTA
ncbi:TonB-dependent receptor plug domain-containing protein [Massilia sp. B-10]|nr:TonB-dependent receptor plug domain-containing protein [Massilia sp. B-10]